MRIIVWIAGLAAGLYIGTQLFFTAYSADGVTVQSIDLYGPEARAVAAIVAVLLGAYLVMKSESAIGQLIGAACVGAALSLWLPIADFIANLTPPSP